MPPKPLTKGPNSAAPPNPKKRKDPPTNSSHPSKSFTTHSQPQHKKHKSNHPPPNHHRAKQRDARTLATQTSSKAFTNGALDVDQFVKAREYEIRALEQGMRRSKGALNRRAFQQVPKELRRRGAAHDVKKVVKRLRGRAGREMAEDNTPTVNARKRKPTRHQRLRLETVKKLRALGAKRKRGKAEAGEKVRVLDPNAIEKDATKGTGDEGKDIAKTKIVTRKPKVKKATLDQPPVPKAKFRKRQQHKSWLPTHIFHAKRAHTTPPSAPMWKFALPLGPTQKSYRAIHRASSERGAVCWDTSYMATIGLQGEERSVLGMLRALGVENAWLVGAKGRNWRAGMRVLETFVYQREEPKPLIAPVVVIWCASKVAGEKGAGDANRVKRQVFLRCHPSAFSELWEETVRLAKVAKPGVQVEDLRFELGSIELKGPGSTEALLGALWPSPSQDDGGGRCARRVGQTWSALAGLTNAGMLPPGALLAFTVQDPKLHFPPRTIKLRKEEDEQTDLLELVSEWPVDSAQQLPAIFDRNARHQGGKLPSQKAVNRRKSLAKPGEFPEPVSTDPHIPILLYTLTSSSSNGKQHQSTSWHLLAPWKAIQPIWYSLMYYPLSTGQQPRFGGLNEQRQLAFEAGQPWFPADFPGTRAGWEWEVVQRKKRWEEWRKRPKGKRVSWESVQSGEGKGEVGVGWECGWEMVLKTEQLSTADETVVGDKGREKANEGTGGKTEDNKASNKDTPLPDPPSKPKDLSHIPSVAAQAILTDRTTPPLTDLNLNTKLLTIRLTLLTRGVPQTCARIYRLPSVASNPALRKAWLVLGPSSLHLKQKKHALPCLPKDTPPHILQQRLAASLLEPPKAGGMDYPTCPGKADLVGFVTSGNFNLAEGRGTGVGCLLFGKVVEDARRDGEEGRLCIVRNAGESVGRLARWDVV